MAFIHDVMHEVFAVTCEWSLYRMLYSVELVIDWIVVPCFVSVVFSDVAVNTSPSGH